MSNEVTPIDLFGSRTGIELPVRETGKDSGFTEFDEKKRPVSVHIPRDPSATGRAIRTHEAGHVKVQPLNVDRYGYSAVVSNAVENMRVDILHLPHAERSERDLLASTYRHRHQVRNNILPLIKACVEGEFPHTMRRMVYQSSMLCLLTYCTNPIAHNAKSSSRAMELAGVKDAYVNDPSLQAIIDEIWDLGHKLGRMRRYNERPMDLRNTDIREIVHRVAALLELPTPEMGDTPDWSKCKKPDDPIQSALKDGRFQIEDLPKTVECADAKERKRVHAMSGSRISTRQLVRHMVGGTTNRVFRRRLRTRKGNDIAILIDASGSMGITSEKLAKVLESIPSATIGYYAGSGEMRGKLYIYSQDGKRYDSRGDLPRCGGGNAVDYEAMHWLLDLPNVKHRIFVTDEGFCGGKTDEAFDLFNRAKSDGRIVPCATIDELKDHPLIQKK